MPGRTFFLPADHAQQLRVGQAGVQYVPFSIERDEGLLIEEDQLQALLDSLSLDKTGEVPSPYEGIFRLNVATRGSAPPRTSGPGKVTFGEWNGNKKDSFKKVVNDVLLPAVNRKGPMDVVIHVPHGKVAAPINDGAFHIHIWSSPAGAAGAKPPARYWNIPIDCTDNSFSASGQGVAIRDDSGLAVAELVGKSNLYIHHDVCHNGTDNELNLFRRLLEETVDLLTMSDGERVEKQKKRVDGERNKAREAYIQYAAGSLKTRVESLRRNVDTERQKLETAQKQLTEAVRRVKEQEDALELLITSRSKQEQELGDEYDRLLSARCIKDVQVTKEKITVVTDVLYCVDPRTNKRHKIGAFRIELFLNGGEDCVRWFNQTQKVYNGHSNMNAPHVDGNGKGCLGSIKYDLPKLMAKMDFSSAIMLAITFIESVNTDDAWGKTIDRWPVE